MTNQAILNNVDHHDLRVIRRYGAEFGDSVNQVLLFPTEFEAAQREFPVLFRQDEGGNFQSVALLGLDRDENLFLDGDAWHTRYVPAVQARGPFSIVLQEQQVDGKLVAEPMIYVDLDDPRVGRSEGELLFRQHGGNTPYLDHVAGILQAIHVGLQASEPMFAMFQEFQLIEPVRVEIMLSDEKQYNLTDYYTIGADRLAELDGSALERLHKAGVLSLAFQALSSLGNVSRLIDLKNARSLVG